MKKPRIELICIGTELLTGKVNSHTATIGVRLGAIGLAIAQEQTVSDDPDLMEQTFREVWKRSDVVICSGGLGPTFDDLTRDVWSRVLKRRLLMDPGILKNIRAKFQGRGIEMPEKNRLQAYVLKGAQPIPNQNGTAPGQILKVGRKTLVLLPGPARELVPMLNGSVITALQKAYSNVFSVQKSFQMVGVPESVVDEKIRPLVERYSKTLGCEVTHGILASASIITVKFRVEGRNRIKVKAAAQYLTHKFRAVLKEHLFGENDDTLPGVLAKMLRQRKNSLAVAESCTGGTITKMLTDIAGASEFLKEGIVTYSNRSKVRRLGVRNATLERHGAVSSQVAHEMAQGIRRYHQVDYALSVTGIAGPTGGSKLKPVGLVYIGCAGPDGVRVKKFHFKGSRDWIRHRAAVMALDMLRRELKKS